MGINEKLLNIQSELKAPKGQMNNFGNYRYRSCEDILEAVKPLLKKYKLTMRISDDIVEVGGRIYVRANVTITDTEKDFDFVTNMAYARESEAKKGMDESQLTGTASSYARKYALNGMFLIDDTKDADTDEFNPKKKMVDRIKELSTDLTTITNHYGVKKIENLTEEQMKDVIKQLEEIHGRKNQRDAEKHE